MVTVMMGTGKTKMEICFFMDESNVVHTEHVHASGISGRNVRSQCFASVQNLSREESPSQKYVL